MSITVTGRKMPVTDALREYAEDKIGNSMKVMDINPLDAEVVLHVEKNPANATPAICEVTLRTKGHIVRVEESEEDMYAAIDVAAAKVLRQLRKFKTRVLDRTPREAANRGRGPGADRPAGSRLLRLHRPRHEPGQRAVSPRRRRLRPAEADGVARTHRIWRIASAGHTHFARGGLRVAPFRARCAVARA